MSVNGGPVQYHSPFYKSVDPYVRNELNARANIHGQRVRGARATTSGTGGGDAARNLNWAYGKKPWCRIVSAITGTVLGSPGSPVMSNRAGNLTMYNAVRNVPNRPLLQSLDISNEGTMGSLLKGKFTFTLYPNLNQAGFELGNIEDAFFQPGAEVNVSWGWSVSANNAQACTGKFTGIIYHFSWSVNPDLSITADCSIVSAATISSGMSGDVNKGEDPAEPAVTIGTNPLPGSNIASVIDKDLAGGPGFAATFAQARMTQAYIGGTQTACNMLEYIAIGLPFQSTEPEGTGNPDPVVQSQGASQIASSTPPTPPIVKPFYYVKLQSVVGFINKSINQLEAGATGTAAGVNETIARLFRVQVYGNFTAHNSLIRSAFPIDVYFPDDIMGEYGGSSPFTAGTAPLRWQPPPPPGTPPPPPSIAPPGVFGGPNIAIGEILIGTDFLKKTYKEFVAENAANISHKNLTSFFETICKRINYASGDVYQISPVLIETEDLSGAPGTWGSRPPTQAILTIEDTNMCREIVDPAIVNPYTFGVDISRALIRNASISCKPPAASAAAAYVAARGSQRTENQPSNSDVKNTPTAGTGAQPPSVQMTNNQNAAQTDMAAKIAAALNDGFNNSWGEQFRGLITKWKKTLIQSTPPGGGNGNGHWMNKAVYPIDLTLTIDGIMGFKFGDTIRCLAIPARYNRDPWNVTFTVTKVSHKIDAGAWTTTLNTKARVSMGG